mgnify:CR=1 FL=1
MATVNKQMTIRQLLEVDEGVADILMGSGMHCLGCVMASGEDIGQACAVHGIDADALIDQINDYLKNK